MIKPEDILGMNARNRSYTVQNSKSAKSLCTSKYASKILLQNNNIPTAQLHGVFATIEDINSFDWTKLTSNFVIKPTNGNAGKGVIVFRKKIEGQDEWIDVLNKTWTLDDIKIHCYDILEGKYSTYGIQHNVIVEERVVPHPKLLKYSYKGTPDIRIVVYNNVPVMALLRLPTKESEGRANQTQGAIGVGIDIGTGITTYATAHKDEPINYLPGTKKKLNGIKIPYWDQALETAVSAAHAANLAYSGIDLFLDKNKGPMVVELNANPGLSIQIANRSGLRKRLQRIDDLDVRNVKHGVKIGQALFAETFADQIKAQEGLTIIDAREQIEISNQDKSMKVPCLINTGRYKSAISWNTAQSLDLINFDAFLWFKKENNEGKVPVVEVKFKLKNQKRKTVMLVTKRLNRSKHKVEIGRKDLAGFLVTVEN